MEARELFHVDFFPLSRRRVGTIGEDYHNLLCTFRHVLRGLPYQNIRRGNTIRRIAIWERSAYPDIAVSGPTHGQGRHRGGSVDKKG